MSSEDSSSTELEEPYRKILRGANVHHPRTKGKHAMVGKDSRTINKNDPLNSKNYSGHPIEFGKTEKSWETLSRAFEELGVQVRYNVRSKRAEIRFNSDDWQDYSESLHGPYLRESIAARFIHVNEKQAIAYLRYSKERWADALGAILYVAQVDPFKEWLEALPPPSGTPELDGWLSKCFDVSDENDPLLVAWASRFIFLGTVWGTFEPGTKLDEMPVLCGPQGIGKSMSLKHALPQHMPDLFSDGLNLTASTKEAAEALQGRAIVEVAEMAGSNRAELTNLKSILSRDDDGVVRLAYRPDPVPSPRRASIVGTTNEDAPLPNDPSGNRRFVVIRLKGGDAGKIIKYMNDKREKLWAEAVEAYRKGEQAWLPPELKAAQAKVNETARRGNEILEGKVEKWLGGGRSEGGFTMEEICRGVDLEKNGITPMKEQKEAASILGLLEYSKKRERVKGDLAWIWRIRD